MDTKLNFEKHLDEKIAKSNSGLGLMKLIKKWVPNKTLEQVYKLYVRPHIDHADIIYHVAELNRTSIFPKIVDNALSKRVEIVQYKAARIVTGAWKGTDRKKLYDDLGWETLSDRRTCRKLMLLYEIQKEKFPQYLSAIVDEQQIGQDSRFYNMTLLKNYICPLNRYKLSFFPSTVSDWNKLDVLTKKAESLQSFKNKMFQKVRSKKKSYFGISDEDARYITLLRVGLSPLRAHKAAHNFGDTSNRFCTVCTNCSETTAHYLTRCKSFRLTRQTLFQNVENI